MGETDRSATPAWPMLGPIKGLDCGGDGRLGYTGLANVKVQLKDWTVGETDRSATPAWPMLGPIKGLDCGGDGPLGYTCLANVRSN